MKEITLTDLRKWGACYSDEQLTKMAGGRDSWTPLQIARMRSVCVEDRIWVLLRSEVLGAEFMPVLYEIVDRAVRKHCLECGVPEVEAWAKCWLSGEDRSKASANAAYAAWAARDAADAAADADAAAARAAYAAARAASCAAAADAADAAAAAADERKAQLRIIKRALVRIERGGGENE